MDHSLKPQPTSEPSIWPYLTVEHSLWSHSGQEPTHDPIQSERRLCYPTNQRDFSVTSPNSSAQAATYMIMKPATYLIMKPVVLPNFKAKPGLISEQNLHP